MRPVTPLRSEYPRSGTLGASRRVGATRYCARTRPAPRRVIRSAAPMRVGVPEGGRGECVRRAPSSCVADCACMCRWVRESG